MEPNGFYGKDLAYVHDHGYLDIAIHAADFLLDHLRERNLKSGLVTDLGCGSGKFLERVAAAGYDTLGVDCSADLLEIGRRRLPAGRFECQSIYDFVPEPCVAVTAVGEVITYRFENGNTSENLTRLFQDIYDKLQNGGILLLDFLEPGLLSGKDRDCKVVRGEEWIIAIEYRESIQDYHFQRDITLFRKLPDGLYRGSREIHEVRLLKARSCSIS